MELRHRRVVVVGAARSGLAAAAALARRGADVVLADRKPLGELAAAAAHAAEEGFKLAPLGPSQALLKGCSLVVLSPGVPGSLPFVREARAAAVEIISEIELAFRLKARRWVAVTGTNGKTTTTSLIHAMALRAGEQVLLGGNIGVPLSDKVEDAPEGAVVVAEVSSFQLEDVDTFKPVVGVWTNLTPDHQDRYPDAAAYTAAKARLFEAMDGRDHLVTNAMDAAVEAACAPAKAVRWRFARGGEVPVGAWELEGSLFLREPGAEARVLLPLSELRLRGPHNLENALAAVCACAALGLPDAAMRETLRHFAGVEHRLEACGEARDVRFVNDSKATNVDSVMKALNSFEEPIHLILGGRDKGGDFGALAALVRARVARVYTIGEAAAKVESALKDAAPVEACGNLEAAMRRALAGAHAGEWILLSPGCASFDQFKDYEDRGRTFKRLALALKEETMR